jgi:hypothetical protein
MSEVSAVMKLSTNIIYKWANRVPEFCDMMIRARTQQAHILMDKAHEQLEAHLARDDAKNGRQAVEAYIKLAEKFSPQKYGVRHVEYKGEIETRMSEGDRNLKILELLARANPELFKEHVPDTIEIPYYESSPESIRLLEDSSPRAGERSFEEVEARPQQYSEAS